MNRLLIISCSQRKVKSPELLPAIDRYDGPTYQILRKFHNEKGLPQNLDIRIISSLYGLIRSNTPIRDYDLRMTDERADQITLAIQNELNALLKMPPRFCQVFIHLGKTYRCTLDGVHWGLISTLEASGGIGEKNAQMKVWLEKMEKETL